MNDTVDTGAIHLEGGYFMLNDGDERIDDPGQLCVDKQDKSDEYVHCFTYKNHPSTIREALLHIITNAKKKIFIASFLIGDSDLIEALYEAVERLRGGVYVISALDQISLERGIAQVEDEHGVDIKTQKKQFDDLTDHGIYVRGHESCHAKFVVVDDEVALISSANLATRALTITGENGLIVRNKQEVQRITRFFVRMWYSGCNWEVPPGKLYTVQERSIEACPCEVPIPQTQDTPGVIWTHDDEQIIRGTIHDVIKRAREELLISTFSLCEMTEHPEFLIDPLRKAIEQHNLRVRFLMRSRNHFETQRRDAQSLAEIGVEIFADSLNHAKGIIADESAAALFSANFDARHGLNSGVETGVRLDGLPALNSAKRYFEYAMRNSNIGFMINPRQKDVDRRLAAGWCGKWPFDHGIAVECSGINWQEFKEASASGPVLFTCDNRDAARLYAGHTEWDLLFSVNGRKTELSPAGWLENAKSTNDLLKRWLRNVQRDKSVRVIKGFCSAVFNRSS